MSKVKLKEKILAWYDRLFSPDHELLTGQPNFWSEFFLLRPKCKQLNEALRSSEKESVQLLVDNCLKLIVKGF